MPFSKIKTEKLSEHAVKQIIRAISSGELRVGDKLPAVWAIAQQMGISKSSAREALTVLCMVRVLRSVHGEGFYVSRFVEHTQSLAEEVACLVDDSRPISEVLEARRALEDGVVTLAVNRKVSSQDIASLAEALEGMKKAIEQRDIDVFAAADRMFHLGIAKATGNSIVERVFRYFLDGLEQRPWRDIVSVSALDTAHFLTTSYEIHRRILDGLQRGDEGAVNRAVRENVSYFEKALLSESE